MRRMACRLLEKIHVKDWVKNIDAFLFDCDGVLWNEDSTIPGSVQAIDKLRNLGKKIFFVTNNSSKSRLDYVQKCAKLGFSVKQEEIVCTSYLAALYLKERNFTGKVYLVGSSGLEQELTNFNIPYIGPGPDPMTDELSNWVKIQLDPEVDCVVVGYDPHISYLKVLKGASYLKRPGSLFVATNEDNRLPLEGELVIPGTGTIVAPIRIASEREPVVVGKPHSMVFDMLKKDNNLDPNRTVMVGDRLNTDIALANNCGLKSLLVLTGISTLDDVRNSENSLDAESKMFIPNFYLPSIEDFTELLNGIQ